VSLGSDLAPPRHASVPSGFAELDRELPGGGWPAGVLTELLPSHEGIGELRLLGPALAALSARRLRLAWIAPPYLPYAPAITAAGIDTACLVIVKTKSEKDALWATEQALASNTCGAVLAWLSAATYAELRRLQLAAEAGEALALLFRPPDTARASSPAALRLALCTAQGQLAVHILKRRGAPLVHSVRLPAMPLTHRKRSSGDDMDRPSPPPAASGNAAARIAFA
jgi:cell division inhibitor SulA/protein ImuA